MKAKNVAWAVAWGLAALIFWATAIWALLLPPALAATLDVNAWGECIIGAVVTSGCCAYEVACLFGAKP